MKHFPGIYKRGRLYWFKRHVGKKPKYWPLKTDDLGEAIRKAQDIIDSEFLSEAGELTADINAFLDHKKALKVYTPASIDSKGAVLKSFAKFMSGSTSAEVTTANVQAFYDDASTRVTPSTAQGYVMMLRAFFRWIVDERKIRRDNPTVGVRMVRVETIGRKDFCTPELVSKLIKEAPNEDLRFILFCGFHAGLRKQEIIEARAFWFDLDAKKIHLRKHDGIAFKDREERSIPMSHDFLAFLRRYGLREPYVLRPDKRKGKSIYRYDFDRPFGLYMAAQGCSWVTTHIMRHTFASLLASSGESIFRIAVWMGDDVRVVQKHYAKLLPVESDIGKAFAPASLPSLSGCKEAVRKRPRKKSVGSRRSQA